MDSHQHVFRWRGWISMLLIMPACIVTAFSRPWFVEGAWFDVVGDFVGWLLLGAGIFLRHWATLYIGGRKSIALVTTGPYALCRHPLYVASFLILLSLAVFLLSVTLLATAILAAIVYAWGIVPSEEQHALTCFGDDYRAYARSTPRFFPKRFQVTRPGAIEIKVGAFLRECARTYGLIVLGATVDLLAYGRTQPWWPAPFHAP